MKVYTTTGDKGQTSLYDGSRISKGSLRVESYGTLDELSAFMGLVKINVEDDFIKEKIEFLQRKLFYISAELAIKDEKKQTSKVNEDDVNEIEQWIDFCLQNTELPKAFLISGTSQADAYLHVCRTICRRGERILVKLNELEELNPELMKYINRMSDLFYAMGRKIALTENKF